MVWLDAVKCFMVLPQSNSGRQWRGRFRLELSSIVNQHSFSSQWSSLFSSHRLFLNPTMANGDDEIVQSIDGHYVIYHPDLSSRLSITFNKHNVSCNTYGTSYDIFCYTVLVCKKRGSDHLPIHQTCNVMSTHACTPPVPSKTQVFALNAARILYKNVINGICI